MSFCKKNQDKAILHEFDNLLGNCIALTLVIPAFSFACYNFFFTKNKNIPNNLKYPTIFYFVFLILHILCQLTSHTPIHYKTWSKNKMWCDFVYYTRTNVMFAFVPNL